MRHTVPVRLGLPIIFDAVIYAQPNMVLELREERIMLTIGLTAAKRNLEELVARAKRGERIRITKYGKIKAEIARPQRNETSATGKDRKDSAKAPPL